MEEGVEEGLSKVAGVIEEEGEEGVEAEVGVAGIDGRRMEKQLIVKEVEGRVVVVSNIPHLQTPKLLLPSFINMRSRCIKKKMTGLKRTRRVSFPVTSLRK